MRAHTCAAGFRAESAEIGYGARELHILTTLSLSPTYMTSMTHVVLARDLCAERLPGDEPEELEVVEWKLSRLHELNTRQDVSEGRPQRQVRRA